MLILNESATLHMHLEIHPSEYLWFHGGFVLSGSGETDEEADFLPACFMGGTLTAASENEVAMETGNSAATHQRLCR